MKLCLNRELAFADPFDPDLEIANNFGGEGFFEVDKGISAVSSGGTLATSDPISVLSFDDLGLDLDIVSTQALSVPGIIVFLMLAAGGLLVSRRRKPERRG